MTRNNPSPHAADQGRAATYDPRGDPPAEFRRIFLHDIGKYAEIVKAAKIEPQ